MVEHLVMDDLTYGRQWPCIMDVKVGTRTYEHDASAEKIAYEKQKFPLQERVGFRIQGIKVFQPANQQYVEFDKHFGRQAQSPEGLVLAFGKFFSTYESDKRKTTALLRAVRLYYILSCLYGSDYNPNVSIVSIAPRAAQRLVRRAAGARVHRQFAPVPLQRRSRRDCRTR